MYVLIAPPYSEYDVTKPNCLPSWLVIKPRNPVFRVADADSLFLGACPEGADDSENVDLIFCQCQDDLAEFCDWNIDAGDCPVGLAADTGKLEL